MSMDPNVDRVCQKMQDRAYMGYRKYGTTTERTDINLEGWLTHLQEELMDACVYIERIKNVPTDSKERQLQGGQTFDGLPHLQPSAGLPSDLSTLRTKEFIQSVYPPASVDG